MGLLNMNMNMNMDMTAPVSSVGGNGTSVRFNTQDWRKYVKFVAPGVLEQILPANPELISFPSWWDADLRSYEYLAEALAANPGWQAALVAALPAADQVPPHQDPNLLAELTAMLNAAPDREDRFLEIIDQHPGERAINYFLGMLMIDPARMPATHLLIRVARRLGEHVVMCLKGQFMCPRPSQLCTAIVPMIDPPATPAYPSGHSLQARLICLALKAATPAAKPDHLLEDLADRIGWNRVIAGLHYPKDHRVGVAAADWYFTTVLQPLLVDETSLFSALLAVVKSELAQRWERRPPPPAKKKTPAQPGTTAPSGGGRTR